MNFPCQKNPFNKLLPIENFFLNESNARNFTKEKLDSLIFLRPYRSFLYFARSDFK